MASYVLNRITVSNLARQCLLFSRTNNELLFNTSRELKTNSNNETQSNNTKSKLPRHFAKKSYNREKKILLEETKQKASQLKSLENGIEILQLASKDPHLAQMMTTARSQQRNDNNRLIILEGRRLILDALLCGLHLEALLVNDNDKLNQIKDQVLKAKQSTNAKLYKVTPRQLEIWSTLTTPPGLLGIFKKPSTDSIKKGTRLPITVVCDNIREPNNLGSLIRTSAAAACAQIVLMRGCCDPWESKSLRGGCGGHFRLPIRDNTEWEELPNLIPHWNSFDCNVFIAENNVQQLQNNVSAINYMDADCTGLHNVVFIGGESHGVSENAYKIMNSVRKKGRCLFIPLANEVESLNVASALTLIVYEMRRKLLQYEEELNSCSVVV